MPLASPVRYSPALETFADGESATIGELNDAFGEILETTAPDYGHAVRAVHAKAHGILQGILTVDENLPPELAQGLFSRAGEHKAYVRLSTNAGDILDDAISLPRGLALKILDVAGERLPDAAGTAQDFIFVNGKVFQASTASEFLQSLKLLAKTTDRAEGLKKALSGFLRGVSSGLKAVGLESPAVNSLGGAPNVEPLGETYYSVTPFRYGDYVAKFSLAPITTDLVRLSGKTIDPAGDKNAIRTAVQKEMRNIDAEYEFRVQLCRDATKQPIEDPTVEWNEDEAPFRRVGSLRIPSQDSWNEEAVALVNEQMRFSVWTGLLAHQPLGNINRARKSTYEHSSAFRAAYNRCPIHEPGALGVSRPAPRGPSAPDPHR